MTREAKAPQILGTIRERAKNKVKDLGSEFTEGLNVLLLLHRKKDSGGGTTNEDGRRLAWFVVRDSKQYEDCLFKLMLIKNGMNDGDYRIYASVNPRNATKAVLQLQKELLELQYGQDEQKGEYFRRLDKKWVSCLMSQPNKERNYFLWDIDDENGQDMCGEALKALKDFEIVKQYKTKNGWHIITKPNNPTGIPFSMKKDALLLLDY